MLLKFLLRCLVVTLAWAVPALAYGTTYYVAKTGSNSYSCTQAQASSTPKLTIAGGLSCLTAGDTLTIYDGTYAEYITFNQLVSGLSDSQRTTVRAATAGTVTLKPTSCTPTTGTSAVVWVYGKSYITFDGLIVDGVNCAFNVGSDAFLINNSGTVSSHHVTLQNMEVQNGYGGCVDIAAPAQYVIVQNSKIHDCGGPGASHGIYAQGSNTIIERNEIYNSTGYGVHQFHQSSADSHNNIIRYNYLHHNGSYGAIIGSGNDNLVHHNIVSNNTAGGIRSEFSSPQRSLIYNNTIYANGICIRIGSGNAAMVKNNVCLSNSTNTIQIGTATATVIANNRLSTDATLVVDASANRFSPREGSALIDAGETISGFSSGRFVGPTPDQGALEAPIYLKSTVENGDANKIRVTYAIPSQSLRSGTGLSSTALPAYPVLVAGTSRAVMQHAIAGTDRSDILINGPAVGAGQVVALAFTRGALTDNVCIGGSLGGCKNAEVRTYSSQIVTNNVLAQTVAIPYAPSFLQVTP
jgi:hypothetical protein